MPPLALGMVSYRPLNFKDATPLLRTLFIEGKPSVSLKQGRLSTHPKAITADLWWQATYTAKALLNEWPRRKKEGLLSPLDVS